jgi:hypothetical protein
VPYAAGGTGIASGGPVQYDEEHAKRGPAFDPGWQLMPWLLK